MSAGTRAILGFFDKTDGRRRALWGRACPPADLRLGPFTLFRHNVVKFVNPRDNDVSFTALSAFVKVHIVLYLN